jgi:hypothetical protein
MRYFFESVVEKVGTEYLIQLPFNVWEVCKLRDVIQADMVLDNRIIECKLLPKEKGNYEVHVEGTNPAMTEMENKNIIGIPHKILIHVFGSLVRMDQNSPYSFDKPIRKIDRLDIIIQPEDGLCGQACVAMLAGVTIAEVISVMDCREWQATMGMMISALNYYGIDHSDVIMYTEGKGTVLPKCCIMMEKMGRFCHYLVYFDGKYYDTNLGVMEEYDMSQLLGYLEIRC